MKNKKLIISSLIMSLFSVFAGAVSTFAWFQLDSQAPEANITTHDPNLSITNADVTGYKVQHTLGSDGFIDRSSSTVTAKKGNIVETTNYNQADADTNFDVPKEGVGYYLVKKNPSGSFKYNYDGSSYSLKFTERSDATVHNMFAYNSTFCDFIEGDELIIRQYQYNSSTYSTVNQEIYGLSTSSSEIGISPISGNKLNYIITINASGTYKIWFNSNLKQVSIDPIFTASEAHKVNNSKYPIRSESTIRNNLRSSGSIDVYYAVNTTYTVKANANTGSGWPGSVTMTKQSYLYNDLPVYKATITYSNNNFYEIQFLFNNGGNDWVAQLGLNNTLTDASTLHNKIWWSGSNQTRDNFKDPTLGLIYDGWIIIGKSGTGSTTFGNPATYDFSVSQAHRLVTSSGNLGQIQITLNPGDNFKIAYLKKGSAGEWAGADKLELYYDGDSTTSFTYVGIYFQNMNSDENCAVRTDINSFSCTIYYTNSKKINVNPASSVILKASKFNFSGTFEEVDSTNVLQYDTTFGSSVSVTTINNLSNTFVIPAKYTRVDNLIYSDDRCTTSVGSSFIANANPLTIYIKVKENAISVTLIAFFADSIGTSTGYEDNARTKTLSSQYGVNSTVTASSLETYWKGSTVGTAYATELEYAGARYTLSRIDNSSHNGAYSDTVLGTNTTLYVRYVRVTHSVTLVPSYFATNDDNSLTRLDIDCGQETQTETILDNNSFETSKTFANTQYTDNTDGLSGYGIFYTFARADENWYTDPDCTTPVNGYSGKPTSNSNPGTLYAKMVCPKLVTHYLDIEQTNWGNCKVHIWGSNGQVSSDTYDLKAKEIISGKLYRFSAPCDITGVMVHNGTTSGLNQTNDFTESLSTSKYLLVGNESGDYGHRYLGSISSKETHLGTAYLQKYVNGAWENIKDSSNNPITMEIGDGVGNDFIYEHGLQLATGTIVRVYTGTTGYGYSAYVDGNKSTHKYAATGLDGAGVTLTNFSGTARFNFYLTHDRKLSIAMVPDYGNGYYIMDYDSSRGTNNFSGAIKMDSNEYSAEYIGYYSEGDESHRIFIRSYLNAVDTHCATLVNTNSSVATMTDGLIQFNGSGHYNIYVTGSSVMITRYSSEDFFSLNYLDSSLVTGDTSQKKTAIWSQKTTLILEVPFTCNNPYDSQITLLAEGGASYIGLNLYVSSSRIDNGNSSTIYNTLRGTSSPSSYYTGLVASTTTTPIVNANSDYASISAGDASTHYAYIMIDYMYNVTEENVLANSPELVFYLQSQQI